jgi:hypothetical protein
MKIRPRIALVGLGIGLISAIALAAVNHSSASDAAIQASFITHRADLEKLVAMSNQDTHLTRIATDFTWLDDNVAWPRKDVGISEDRWDDYRKLFRSIGISNGIIRHSNPTRIFFPVVSEGLVPTGIEKGLVYSQAPLNPILKSLDTKPPRKLFDGPDHTHVLVYRPIEDHWYIYYQEW